MDISRFHATFFEESRENIAAMEAGLLAMEGGEAGADTIHVIFRAAHSIKGGSATFGFTAIADFTHLLETLLEEARSGRRVLDAAAITALLNAVDALRMLLAAAEQGQPVDQAMLQQARAGLEAMLNAGAAPAPAAPAAQAKAEPKPIGWHIDFAPERSLFMTGNDPLRMLRELGQLGELKVHCRDDALPPFTELDPFEAWLAWDLQLIGDVKRSAIEDTFAWVEDQCKLTIEPLLPSASAAEAPPAAAAAPAATSAATPPAPASPPPASPAPAPQTPAAQAAAPQPAAARPAGNDAAETTIRVSVDKVDALINLVGELVITQAMLAQRSAELDPALHEKLLAGLEQLDRNTRDLQEAVMSVRMLPVDFAFSRFPRMVRDIAARLGKKVILKTSGEGTELDKGVIEKIVDPLVHLVRNAIDHGLETTEQRIAAGKPEAGTVTLSAAHQGGHIIIEVSDDGRGLDREKILAKAAERGIPVPENPTDAQVWDLVFAPGFSTAETLTDLSGRGVGMDVVRKNIQALGGQVEIRSRRGEGTTVSIRLPLTMAILDGMTVSVGGEVFILPLNIVIESLQPQPEHIKTVTGGDGRVLRVREDYVPLLDLATQYGLQPKRGDALPIAVVVEAQGQRMALEVDELLGQQQVVVKNLERNYRRIPGVAGATILGDGRVALIVDVASLPHLHTLPIAA
ncbi:MAG: chemotaxis protein CheA [Thermomonas hydrothermalis]|uniref:chemotaxis protein CheA n=1 Tax=Thermomonas hydrothermalis TaxID=213588 RepID=UPI002352AA88|nr:chemotaxis protein CheA [Thermomonas hydrothermalis]MCL6620307.1 chemotaxis protein CheA [Thermomonas hydrothermalis]